MRQGVLTVKLDQGAFAHLGALHYIGSMMESTQLTPAQVVHALHGIQRAADAVGVDRDTIEAWIHGGEIPEEYRVDVLIAGVRRSIDWRWRHLFRVPSQLTPELLGTFARAGLTTQDTARALEADLGTVAGLAITHDLRFRRSRGRRAEEWQRRHAEILQLHHKGLTPLEIAEKRGWALGNVTDHLRRAMVTPNTMNAAGRAQLARIRKLAGQGKTIAEIAAAIDRDRGHVSRLCAAHGILPPHGGGWRLGRPKKPTLSPEGAHA